ncbi:MAG: glycosyltransferase family 4 protein [Haloarculaceae archaeon]
MRVAFVAMYARRETDGIRRLRSLAERLAARGHEVSLFCTQWWPGYDRAREETGVVYRPVTLGPEPVPFALRLPVMLARFRPDVVHVAPEPPGSVLAARAGATLARAPLVCDWYGDETLHEGRRTRWAARTPDAVVTPSEMVAGRVLERGADSERVRVVPVGVDTEYVRSVAPREDAADVVYARRLDADANLESLLLALAEFRRQEWTAVVIGDGPAREAYEQQAVDLRIDDRVEFVGERDREERVATYRGAHVFVQTARRACFATELLWALVSGCVGIVEYQADSSAHELIRGRERGFRVTTPEEVAGALARAGGLEHLDFDDSFDDFDERAVLERYLECYRDLR